MERFTAAHRKLQIFCADFWNSQEAVQVILDEVGLNSNRLDLSEPSLMRWYSIINEMIKKNDGALGRLVVVLMNDYPDNKSLREVCSPWIPAEPAKPSDLVIQIPGPEMPAQPSTRSGPGQAATKKAEDIPVPEGSVLVAKFHKAAPDDAPAPRQARGPAPELVEGKKAKARPPSEFEIEEETLLSRVETLWLAMVEQEQRLVKLEKTSRKKEMDISKATNEA